MPTFDAPVFDGQVRLEILVTWFHVEEVFVEDAEAARVSPGTVPIEDVQYVVGAADVAEVLSHTLAQVHSTVAGSLHLNDLVLRLAFGAKELRLADDLFRRIS